MSISTKSTAKVTEAVRPSAPTAPTGAFSAGLRAPAIKAPPVEIKQAAPVRIGVVPSPEDVRNRAYEIYMARRLTGASGNPDSDWLQAERELRVRA